MSNNSSLNYSIEELFPSVETLCEKLKAELTKDNPKDIYQYCADYFNQKLIEQRLNLLNLVTRAENNNEIQKRSINENKDLISLPADFPVDFSAEEPINTLESTDGSDVYLSGNEIISDAASDSSFLLSSSDDDDVPFEPPSYNRGRRTSISAESMAPTKDGEFVKIYVDKNPEQRSRIESSISNNFLFKNLDEEQHKDVIDAMSEKRVFRGEDIIVQGGVGDYFYVVESGSFDVYVEKDGGKVKVLSYSAGGSFGELALMYNAPRAATVTCTEDAVLWALDRVTFRKILMEQTSRKRRMYESFLEEVPLLTNLEPYERHKVADALESIIYNDGEIVLKQGDTGENFYIIESGEASITKTDENGVAHSLPSLKKGDYFGELALLNEEPRKATVSARGRLKCATLGKKAFVRLLGPVVEIIKRNSENYSLTNDDQK
ncbi:camp-dependent protein kinase regulatory subunit [Neoconidiobolus thromboides FSU 785]|nr:camp-dependent protein kinase regulatory subunit [Neoconidiobolus thromboides FSU 785]